MKTRIEKLVKRRKEEYLTLSIIVIVALLLLDQILLKGFYLMVFNSMLGQLINSII